MAQRRPPSAWRARFAAAWCSDQAYRLGLFVAAALILTCVTLPR
jgi:hypothetical protein